VSRQRPQRYRRRAFIGFLSKISAGEIAIQLFSGFVVGFGGIYGVVEITNPLAFFVDPYKYLPNLISLEPRNALISTGISWAFPRVPGVL
jgi:hypothetical protein